MAFFPKPFLLRFFILICGGTALLQAQTAAPAGAAIAPSAKPDNIPSATGELPPPPANAPAVGAPPDHRAVDAGDGCLPAMGAYWVNPEPSLPSSI